MNFKFLYHDKEIINWFSWDLSMCLWSHLCLFLYLQHQDDVPPIPFLLSCYVMIIFVCGFSCCFQMQRRGQPRDSLWAASSITPLCCSARRTTCCTSEPGRRCSPSASRTSARQSCRRMYVWYQVDYRRQKWHLRSGLADNSLSLKSWLYIAFRD